MGQEAASDWQATGQVLGGSATATTDATPDVPQARRLPHDQMRRSRRDLAEDRRVVAVDRLVVRLCGSSPRRASLEGLDGGLLSASRDDVAVVGGRLLTHDGQSPSQMAASIIAGDLEQEQ